ncbi:MAG: hypothetical protein HLUCCX14_12425 [Marinobacter excellens HL-55]|uniref:Uncharacterized protein n=1 Tax=Marinobacter excellens HL-55 TaxID=1305731 RepID=A0A0P8CWP8_9GAMM|nr:MAG: hypothetical protein HLUCCX14_12425 [Marinobacter excellens HL-55]
MIVKKSLGGGAVQECAEPGMAEPKPHRDVLRRLLNGTTTLALSTQPAG